MITLEDQIRRYATDVAGPALGAPPADLDALGSPRHRGRWVLVAALIVFIAGLTWVATRPTELGDRPSVDSVVPDSNGRVVSTPTGPDACVPTAPVDGYRFAGPRADGLCVSIAPFTDPVLGSYVQLSVSADEQALDGFGVRACRLPSLTTLDLMGALDTPAGRVLLGVVPKDVSFIELSDGSLLRPGTPSQLDGARLVAARVDATVSLASILALDADRQPLDTTMVADDSGCPAPPTGS